MPYGPPKALEAVVGLWVPPACREEVLGDLCEKCTGPGQYIAVALSIVPFVIVSRIRRTTDAQVLLMEALLLYASFLAAAGYTGKARLIGQWGLLQLAIPAVLALVVLMLDDAWCPPGERPPLKLVRGVAIGTVFAFLCLSRTLPLWVNLYGGCASLLLVSAVRILFRPQIDRPRAAAGPELWAEPAVTSGNTKSLLAAGAAIALIAVSLATRPGIAGAFIILALVIWLEYTRPRKE